MTEYNKLKKGMRVTIWGGDSRIYPEGEATLIHEIIANDGYGMSYWAVLFDGEDVTRDRWVAALPRTATSSNERIDACIRSALQEDDMVAMSTIQTVLASQHERIDILMKWMSELEEIEEDREGWDEFVGNTNAQQNRRLDKLEQRTALLEGEVNDVIVIIYDAFSEIVKKMDRMRDDQ